MIKKLFEYNDQNIPIEEGSVPDYLQRLITAINSERAAIEEYDALLDSKYLPTGLIKIIKEIQDDEKDHIVKLSKYVDQYIQLEYPKYGKD